jgi:hypothetical protein
MYSNIPTTIDVIVHLAILIIFVIFIKTQKKVSKIKSITTSLVPVSNIPIIPHEIQQKIMLEYWLNVFEDSSTHRKKLINEYNKTVEEQGVAIRIKHQIELDIDTIDKLHYITSIAKKEVYEKIRNSILSKLQIISVEIQRLQIKNSLLLNKIYENDIDRKITLNYINKLGNLINETEMCNERIATIDLQNICIYVD